MTSRPLVIQSARDDHLAGRRGLANVLAPMDELRVAYELSGAVERLYHHIVPGGHHFEKDGALEAIERVTSQEWHHPCSICRGNFPLPECIYT